MKIGIDARMIDYSGIGTYIMNLIYWLPKVSDNKYVLFGNSERLQEFNMPIIESNFQVYGLREQLFFPGIIKKAQIDLFHSAHYTVPILYSKNMIVTIHDLIHLIFPEYLPSKIGHLYAKFMINSACKKAKRIIAVSENTKKDIMNYSHTESYKIRVIYEGVSETFKTSSKKAESARKKYGKYLLYVGLIRPRKNILGIIEAFHRLKRNKRIVQKLMLIGKTKIPYISEIKRKISEYSLENEIYINEDIPKEELLEFYCGADLFVFPSLYEGFGLPPLEAMACGIPVITSNAASLPEVIGDAGIMVDPYDFDMLADAMYKVLIDENLRRQLIKKGFERVKLFSWRKAVEKTLKAYEECFNDRN